MIDNVTEAIVKAEPVVEDEKRGTVALMGFSINDYQGKKRVFNALNSAESLDEARKAGGFDTIECEGIILQPYTETDQLTGEVTEGYGVVFVTADSAYYSRSFGIARSAQNFVQAFGQWPDETVTLRFREVQLDNKRSMKDFVIV